ncbi:carbohydrate ABC transporter permease [Herbiconiux sp. L3-i23]|uniref:carbohydrate ABC transporter permease n=1 Tax=Herbiconiux sp. L3-i23 TaxID=2905871 RepID=UPI002069E738|nr:carbohydrate ABC transporter permease [Herbiconiux sp. L3-i23]BDI23632.1 ABC transporter permease [Herbiconiux sp. L3-i23]
MTATVPPPAAPPIAPAPPRSGTPTHRPARMSAKGRRTLGSVARFVTIGIVALLFLFPIFWMILASLKNNIDIVDPSRTFDFVPTFENFINVFTVADFGRFTFNSFVIAFAATAISLVLGLPAAYAIARYTVRSATAFILLARVIPGVSLLIPWYYLFAQVGIVGTFQVMILSHIFVSLPIIVAIMASFFEGMSIELEEAAQIDGLSLLGAFLRITLPLSVPGIATASILSFIFSWNNFLFALVLSGNDTKTLPVAIFNFIAYASVDWGGLMAASVVITVPVMLVALFVQRYIVSGLTAGATKG